MQSSLNNILTNPEKYISEGQSIILDYASTQRIVINRNKTFSAITFEDDKGHYMITEVPKSNKSLQECYSVIKKKYWKEKKNNLSKPLDK